jgi:hypothetical protein
MPKMISFCYVDFYDVPRSITLRYRGKLFLIQSAFDEELDDYPSNYSVYKLPESLGDSLNHAFFELLAKTPLTCRVRQRIRAAPVMKIKSPE